MKQDKVLCIPSRKAEIWNGRDIVSFIHNSEARLVYRDVAEESFIIRQVIPYIIVFSDTGSLWMYQRRCGEDRLSDMFSIGIGGHLHNYEYGNEAAREFKEETGVEIDPKKFCNSTFQEGCEKRVIVSYDDVGIHHVGIIHEVVIGEEEMSPSKETKCGKWTIYGDVYDNIKNLEIWSRFALAYLDRKMVYRG